MSVHYGQRVEVWDGVQWWPGTVNTWGSYGQIRVDLDDGGVRWDNPFYIRPLQEVRA